jgi:hypothetical protein
MSLDAVDAFFDALPNGKGAERWLSRRLDRRNTVAVALWLMGKDVPIPVQSLIERKLINPPSFEELVSFYRNEDERQGRTFHPEEWALCRVVSIEASGAGKAGGPEDHADFVPKDEDGFGWINFSAMVGDTIPMPLDYLSRPGRGGICTQEIPSIGRLDGVEITDTHVTIRYELATLTLERL